MHWTWTYANPKIYTGTSLTPNNQHPVAFINVGVTQHVHGTINEHCKIYKDIGAFQMFFLLY